LNEIVSLIESLSREIQDFRQETRSGFARIEESSRRHSTAITAGTFSIGGLNKAIERLEALIHDRDQQIADLRDRVRTLEERQGV
jgi:chromosome segregation ATPase